MLRSKQYKKVAKKVEDWEDLRSAATCSPARASVDFIRNVEAAHVVRDIGIKVQQRATGSRYYFRHAAYVVAVLVHQAGENGQQRRLDAITVVDVKMVPAAFRRELLHVHPYLRVRAALDQPGASHVCRVVAEAIMDAPNPIRQSAGRTRHDYVATSARI